MSPQAIVAVAGALLVALLLVTGLSVQFAAWKKKQQALQPRHFQDEPEQQKRPGARLLEWPVATIRTVAARVRMSLAESRAARSETETKGEIRSLLRSQTILLDMPTAEYSQTNYAGAARRLYADSPHVYRAVTIIAQAIADLPLLFYKDNTREKEWPYHPAQSLINQQLLEEAVTHLLLDGNAYIAAFAANRYQRPEKLAALRPDCVRLVKNEGAGGHLFDFGYRIGMQPEVILDGRTVAHIKTVNPLDQYHGLSPVVIAAASITALIAGTDWNVSLLQNAARPSGALVTQGVLSEDAYQQLRKRIKDAYSGMRGAGKTLILDGGLDWRQFSLSPLELDWLAGRQQFAREVAIALGVPPEMLGDSPNKTYSNYQEARKSFYEETVLPLARKFVDGLNVLLTNTFGDVFVAIDKEAIEALAESQTEKVTRANMLFTSKIITLNEARAAVGYEAVPDGDKIVGMDSLSDEAANRLSKACEDLKWKALELLDQP